MTKANRLLIAALVLQVAILVVARFVGTEPTSLKKTPVLGTLDSDAIKRIKIVDDDKVAELERQGDSWVLATGGGYPLKKDKAKELLGKLPGLQAGQPVATKPEHHRALEVSEQDNQRDITLTLKDGKTTRFFLGSSPGIKKVHIRLDGEDDVHVVEGLSTWDIGASASNWVEAEYFKLEKDKVVALSLKNEHGEIKLEKNGGSWNLLEGPAEEKTKSAAIDSLVSSATAVNLNAPVGQQVKPDHQLEPARALLSVVTETKIEAKDAPSSELSEAAASQPTGRIERKTHVLRIGGKMGDEGYYAKSDSSQFVVRLATWTAETFVNKKRADLLEDKKKDDKKKPQAQKTSPAIPSPSPVMPSSGS